MSALDNVELPMIFAGVSKKQRKSTAEKLLEAVGLGQRIHHSPSELSAGEQQRVAIARALANDPAVLLMDEPTGNLDEENTRHIMELALELNEGRHTTFLLTTHNLLVAKYAKKTYLLQNGELTESS